MLWVSRFIFSINSFCCWSFFHLSRFLFNFESSCVWLFTQLPPPKAMYTPLSVSDPCLYFLPGCFLFILFSHWFLCSPDYLVLTWFSYFVFIIASAISVSKLFYWTKVPALNVGGLWIHCRANLQFSYKHSIESPNLHWLQLWGRTLAKTHHICNIAAHTHGLIWSDEKN